jgi:hypothetical protein
MEIIIRTSESETVVHPEVTAVSTRDTTTPSGAAAGSPPDVTPMPPDLAASAAAIGANNVGAAPSAPEETGTPPVNVTVAQERAAPTEGAAGESAGAAPDLG